MKFVLTREHVYPWPITVALPNPDKPGEIVEQKFTMTFRAMPLDEAEKLDAEISALPADQQAARQYDMMRKVAQGWDDQVVDDAGKPVPFSSDAFELAMVHSWFRLAVLSGYRQSLQGRAAQQGN